MITESANDAPVCSVCIANFNGLEVLEACLDSVLAQTCNFPVEIIVYDDVSPDRSWKLVADKYPEVRLLVGEVNVGFCVANNRMVEVARGRYVLLLNNDAELFPDALSTLYAAAESIGGPAIIGLPQYRADDRSLIDMGSLFDPFLNPVPNLDPEQRDVGMVIGACLWLRRSDWNHLGGFPEWFHTLAEDMYLCCVARLWGWPVIALSESGFRHHVGFSLGGGKLREGRLVTRRARRARSECNKTFVLVLTYPRLLLWFWLPVHLTALLIEGALLAILKGDRLLWREVYWEVPTALWRERLRLRSERRQIQLGRRVGLVEFWRVFGFIPHKMRLLWRHGFPEII